MKYTKVLHISLKNTPDNWDEFEYKVNNTTGGVTDYGNDCSGFASICWRLGTRYKTWDFEADAITDGGYCHSLGSVGSAAQVNLVAGGCTC